MDSDSAAMTGSSDAANTPIASSAAVDAVLEYIVAVLQALLGASEGDVRRSLNRQSVTTGGSVHAIGVSATTTDDAYTRSNAHNQELARFITDPALQCVYVNKVRATQTIRAGNAIDDTVKSTTFSPIDTLPAQTTLPRPAYTLTTTLTWHPNNIASVAIIKRSAILDPLSRPLSDQLHVVNLFGPAVSIDTPSITPSNHPSEQTPTTTSANPYESLHSIVHLAVQPYFDAYVSRRSAAVLLTSDATDAQPSDVPSSDAIVLSGTNDITSTNTHEENANTAIPVAKKKIAELELSLLHLQQNVEIPEIVLAVHPAIVRAVGRSKSLNAPKPLPEHVEPPSLLADSTFLNKLQAEVNGWIKEVQTITKLSRDVTSGTASQEINFWLSMEKSLEAIEGQLRSDPVLLALDVLKHAKRFHATVSFLADTGLREATDQVYRYNMLMKDFPLNDLLSATDLERMHDALLAVFNHINKKLKVSPYPIRRALPLAELISRDLAEGILRIMRAQKLMYASYMQFDNVTSTAVQIFVAWEDLIKEFTNVAREVTRKRAEKFLPIKIAAYHVKEGLQARIEYLRTFRKHHEQLVAMVSPTKGVGVFGNAQSGTITAGSAATRPNDLMLGGLDMEEEVRSAYEQVKNVDVLDTSPEGTQIWVNAENAYNERVSRVENQIIARLRDRLGTARNASEMFRVFSRFNALFVRPKIRGAIQEYQTTLIDSVKEDIADLHRAFRVQYKNSEAYHMAQLRDISPIAGAIIWAKQIERQLNTYMRRVEDVLGRGWELYAEGAKLASESASFKRKLDTRPIYEAWLREINRRDMQIAGRVFEITRARPAHLLSDGNYPMTNGVDDHSDADAGNDADATFILSINFDPQIITLFKEVRNLLWLGFSVPHAISNVAKDAKRVYPYALSLMETVRTYTQTIDRVTSNPGIATLVAEYRRDVQTLLAKGMSLRWEYFVNVFDTRQTVPSLGPAANPAVAGSEGRYAAFVRELAAAVSMFQDRTEATIDIYAEVGRIVEELESCAYEATAFEALLQKIQSTVDKLNLEGYANLDIWVQAVDERIGAVLLVRLQDAISNWYMQMSGRGLSEPISKRIEKLGTNGIDHAKNARKHHQTRWVLKVQPATHEVRIINQTIYLDPPIEAARAGWYAQLQQWLGIVCNLPRIQSSRYEIGVKMKKPSLQDLCCLGLLHKLTAAELKQPFAVIEERLSDLTTYVNKWLEFQALWDLEAEYVYGRLGDSLADWQQLLLEIRKTRSTFDTSESHHDMGVAVIRYEQVQAKVNAKYDSWQKDILSRFAIKLGNAMRDSHVDITKARFELEHQSVESSSTAQTVAFITYVQELKKKATRWASDMETYGNGQKTLERQRYQFPSDWLSADQIQVEWASFSEILSRKNSAIQEQFSGLQIKILAEEKVIGSKIEEVLAEWEQNKPIQGDIKYDVAMQSISAFDARIGGLKQQSDMVAKAKEALELEANPDERLVPALEELRDLKAVWTALSGIWSQINNLRDASWTTVQPRKLRQELDALLASTREMPSRMRQYAAFEFVQDLLKSLLKANSLIIELRSEAMRERHWRQLYKRLRLSSLYTPSTLFLGAVWDFDLKKNEGIIKEVITQAQGELALEEFIKQVKELWTSYSLDLVNYQNKTRLIKGWEELFAKCSEGLNSLTAMKHSPYYKVFAEEAALWEDRLTRIHVLFDVWVDVQRQWVYLEGIFSASADIKHLLPMESSRFSNINSEFMSIMKKVFKAPFVLEVLSIPGVQKSLERLADLLSKIQKALGEYLERERASFPRFYFVGDEDLLEIIGNSKDIHRVMKHLKKMFAGLSSLILSETDASPIIEGMVSAEGEQVRFVDQIDLNDIPKINDWLAKLESEMRSTLLHLLQMAHGDLLALAEGPQLTELSTFFNWVDKYPAQIAVLAMQIWWTSTVEATLNMGESVSERLDLTLSLLNMLANAVLQDVSASLRSKCENMITELVHQRDVLRAMLDAKIQSITSFDWLCNMRFYLDTSISNPLRRVKIQMADAIFHYGFEYLGANDRLVQTPLTDRCYLTLTQALAKRLGGSPFGPAGTGKTETVKALGNQLGRFVLVFCCDESFDFQAMGRIFVGLCQVGAWGCFDEFNRLEERMLSAVSQQIQAIQFGLKQSSIDTSIEIGLVGRQVKVNLDTGIFITMNPGYAGRSNLPDNLKKLFRGVAMTRPDRELIAQVMLFSQGFRAAETLASKVVPLFNLCQEQLSSQPHYDFGLRALKSVLVSAGILKRHRLQASDIASSQMAMIEAEILLQSVMETIAPKLVGDDVQLLASLLRDVFPGVEYIPANLTKLTLHITNIANERCLSANDQWLQKLVQTYQIQRIQHGLMLVGPAASGKSTAWRVLLQALERLEGVEGVFHTIDPKAISKEDLYGVLDTTTREWNDGLFTGLLRKIVDNVRGETNKRHWIVFDGDVDPEWVENLNSLLDDNKLLTLPNGERLTLPSNVRIMFEVDTLKYATLATVSRCGMVWFSDDIVTIPMMCHQYIKQLESGRYLAPTDESESFVGDVAGKDCAIHSRIAAILSPFFETDGLVCQALSYARTLDHIMDFTVARALNTLFSLVNQSIKAITIYNARHIDFPLPQNDVQTFIMARFALAVVWSFAGDATLSLRARMGKFVAERCDVDFPIMAADESLIDYDVTLPSGQWVPWRAAVPNIDIDTHAVLSPDIVIPTIDTVRHEEILYSWLSEHKPLLLCGPPGSGKTMTLFNALRKLSDMEVVGLNFSSASTPELLLKTFEQYCEFRKTPRGLVLAPIQVGKWLVLFCDEINLPSCDKYGTQRVISFLRQMVEHGGYWRTSDKTWVTIERIQFVGACNPPTDPGRVALSHRFLRHAPLVMVDYPGKISLQQIYGTFNRAVLKTVPSLRTYSEPLTMAMVDVYIASQARFTTDIQAHYVYSPRELTRWTRGIYESIKPLESLSVEGLARVWAHEALRLFQDRLTSPDERQWTSDLIDTVCATHFPTMDVGQALARPILFSNWTTRNYVPIEREEFREYVKARLRIFYEEELDVPLVLFDDVLDHALRIDRVFRQSQGHVLLIGVSGSGKTTLSRFVAWMNGLSIFQVKVHNKYNAEDFDEDLRNVLRRAGCKGEKVCFIMDESNVLDSGFLERMNTLLANAEVPGLFEGDEYTALMTACKEGAQRDGLLLSSFEELYKWFTQQVARNLHVVFTMNPPDAGLASRAATSPALFNRCVLDWFGDWSTQALFQVGADFTTSVDLDAVDYNAPSPFPVCHQGLSLPPTHRAAMVNAFVAVHQLVGKMDARIARRKGRYNHSTPRHYLDFVNHFIALFSEKREDLEEQQRHVNIGLDKLRATVEQVEELRGSLAAKKTQLEMKNREANDKLLRMVADQREAEQQKVASIDIQAALRVQEEDIRTRKEVVLQDLSAAEPAVFEAQSAVSEIKKPHLTEVRSMANPPVAVKMAMESVCTLLGHTIDSWRTVQGIIRKDDFISSIVNYDTERLMTKRLREKMRAEYISRPEFSYENVNRASRACGPLVKWVLAQVNFSEILDKVGPLREEVEHLERSALTTRQQADTIFTMIGELTDRIELYKMEYADLISETQSIKSEMERVQGKVTRSITLLSSLESERDRWTTGSQKFVEQMSTIAGDVMLSAAFLAYNGYYDQECRETLWQQWTEHLEQAGIAYKHDLAVIEYLSTPDERLRWQSHGLPADNLCVENAIVLQRFNRYPLIVDPTGQAATFLMREYQSRKIAITSFLDEAFTKQLESALRFGTALLVQDVERLDPIVNTILNRELRKAGGRVLIRLGNQDIDFSPAFRMFLLTRDPSVDFPPDICSRVTFANFTMTRTSLQSQSLSQVLRVERPDTEEKRSNLLKLQGEFGNRLRYLERALLQALNESSGNILDDDKVVDTLETLKYEAAEVTRKVQDTHVVMEEITAVTRQYLPLAAACSSIFFALDQLNCINHFYRFSLRFFQDIFEHVLHRTHQPVPSDASTRLAHLLDDLYMQVYKRISQGLLHRDHSVLAVLLAQIKLRSIGHPLEEDEVEHFLGHSANLARSTRNSSQTTSELLTESQLQQLNTLARLPAMMPIVAELKDNSSMLLQAFLRSAEPEGCEVQAWSDNWAAVRAFRMMLIIKVLRPERILYAATAFANAVFPRDLWSEVTYDLGRMVETEVSASTPVCVCSVPGYDGSFRIDAINTARGSYDNSRFASVAMGSQEGYALADQAIAQASRVGSWVMLRNVHLAPQWLNGLEKRLQSLNPHKNFRLFLTLEMVPSIPVNIIRQSRIVMCEPQPGIRANLIDSLQSISAERLNSPGPVERHRLYFSLAWLHAILVERLRYAPVGFSKTYEFNDADQEAALSTIDAWMLSVAKGKTNIAPNNIPFSALRGLLKQAVYGGRVDSEIDQRLLESFVDSIFTPQAYETGFELVPGCLAGTDAIAPLIAPEGTRLSDFLDWSLRLPEREPSSWLALPPNAEELLAIAEGKEFLSSLRKVQSISDDDDETDAVALSLTAQTTSGAVAVHAPQIKMQQPAWMHTMQQTCDTLLRLLPTRLESADSKAQNGEPGEGGEGDALARFYKRESLLATRLLNAIRSDLVMLVDCLNGKLKQTNSIRDLIAVLCKGEVPSAWSRDYQTENRLTLLQWATDFAKRLKQSESISVSSSRTSAVWLGGFFRPTAWITASRQQAAHRQGVSLESLALSLDIGGPNASRIDDHAHWIKGLVLHGAGYGPTGLQLNHGQHTMLEDDRVILRWIPAEHGSSASNPQSITFPCPVYLTPDRDTILFTTNLPTSEKQHSLIQRSICLVASGAIKD